MTETLTLTNKIGPHKPLVEGSNPTAPANLLRPSSHEQWLPRSTQAYLHTSYDQGDTTKTSCQGLLLSCKMEGQ